MFFAVATAGSVFPAITHASVPYAPACQITIRVTSDDGSPTTAADWSPYAYVSTVTYDNANAWQNRHVTLNWTSSNCAGGTLTLGGDTSYYSAGTTSVGPSSFTDGTYNDDGSPTTLYNNPDGGLSALVLSNPSETYNPYTGRYENLTTITLTGQNTAAYCEYINQNPNVKTCAPAYSNSSSGAALVEAQVRFNPASGITIYNNCSVNGSTAGTWTITPTDQSGTNAPGYGYNNVTVQPDPTTGTTYTVSFNPPDKYDPSVQAPASATLYGGDYHTFTVGCTPTPIRCTDGTLAPDNNLAECPCPPPTSQTQTLSCDSGYTGSITQQRTAQPPYPDCPWSDWVTTSNTCVPAACTPPLTETRTESCPVGYTGEIDQQNTKSGPTDNPACTFNDSGWTTTSNTCVPVPTSTINVNSNLAAVWTISDSLGNMVAQASSPETSDSYTVTPADNGTAYTITPGSLSGYTLNTTNNVTGSGSTFSLFGNDAGRFNLAYTQIPPAFAYTLSNSGTASAMQGNPVQEVITKTLTAGSAQAVSLSIPSLPTGVTVSGISSQGCTLTCTSTITLSVDPSTVPGEYPITVDGSPNNQTTQFNLDVAPTPDVNVTCVPSPSVAKVGQSVTWTATATGGSGSYTSYSWSGSDIPTSPNVPTSNPYSIAYSTVGTKSAQATVTDSNGKSGTCTAGTASVSVNPTFQEF